MKKGLKTQSKHRINIIQVAIMAVLILACGGGGVAQPTPTPMPMNTSTPKPTLTPRPTVTPIPTATEVPPTPTPAPVGVAVNNDKYEVNVVNVRRLETVYLDDLSHWAANPGYAFLELGVKVRNLQDGPVEVSWGNIYILDTNGDGWYPNWGGNKSVESGIEVNPTSIIFYPIEDRNVEVAFEDSLFLRLIYTVERTDPPTIILFGFDDSPMIEVALP